MSAFCTLWAYAFLPLLICQPLLAQDFEITSRPYISVLTGEEFTYQIETSAPAQSFWATNLPRGLIIDPLSGLIRGSVLEVSEYEVTVSALNQSGERADFDLYMSILPPVGELPKPSAYVAHRVDGRLPLINFANVAAEGGISAFTFIDNVDLASLADAIGLPAHMVVHPNFSTIYKGGPGVVFFLGRPENIGLYSVTLLITNAYGTSEIPLDFLLRKTAISSTDLFSGYSSELTAVYGNGVFIISSNEGGIFRSYDAITWEPAPEPGTFPIRDMKFDGARFIASAANGVMFSEDGLDWSYVSVNLDFSATSLAIGSNGVVIGGTNTSTNIWGTAELYFSSDLETWTKVDLEVPVTTVNINDITFGNGTYVALSDTGVYVSENGLEWQSASSGLGEPLENIAFGSNVFAATSPTGIYKSETGLNWEKVTETGDDRQTDLIYANGEFVSAGLGRSVYTSPDGIDWIAKIPGFNSWGDENGVYRVTSGQNYYLTLSRRGKLQVHNASWFPTMKPGEPVIGEVGKPLELQLEAYDFPETFQLTYLPPGLELDQQTGKITGTPEEAGVFAPYAVASNQFGVSLDVDVIFHIFAADGEPPHFNTEPLNIEERKSVDELFVGMENSDITTVHSIEGLPEGLEFDTATGIISGNAATHGFYTITVTGSNYYGSATVERELRVVPNAWDELALPVDESFTDIAYGNGSYVAVTRKSNENSSRILVSDDLDHWVVGEIPGAARINDIFFADGLFIGLSEYREIYSSPDGAVWEQRYGGESTDGRLRAVTYGNYRYLAIASDYVLISPNGVSWARHELPGGFDAGTVAYGKDMFVAAGYDGKIYTTRDGVNWTLRSSLPSKSYTQLTYQNGVFLACSRCWTNNSTLIRSTDGMAWFETEKPGVRLNNLSSGNGQFLVSVQNTSISEDGGVYSSTDGLNWTRRYNPGVEDYDTFAADVVFAHGEIFLDIGSGLLLTSNGEWTPTVFDQAFEARIGQYVSYVIDIPPPFDRVEAVSLPPGLSLDSTGAEISGAPLVAGEYSVSITAWNGDLFSAPAQVDISIFPQEGELPRINNDTYVLGELGVPFSLELETSGTDTTTRYSAEGLPPGLSVDEHMGIISGEPEQAGIFEVTLNLNNLYGITDFEFTIEITSHNWSVSSNDFWVFYLETGNGVILASDGRSVYHSVDGENWEQVLTAPLHNHLFFFNGSFYVLGNRITSSLFKSEDGVNWVDCGLVPGLSSISALASGAHRILAVGSNGKILISEDGVTWTRTEFDCEDDFIGAAISEDKLVAITSDGVAFSSEDGIDWVETQLPVDELKDIVYGNGWFLSISENGATFKSADGVDWVRVPFPERTLLSNVNFANDHFWVATQSGNLFASADLEAWVSRSFDYNYSLTLSDVKFFKGRYYATGGLRLFTNEDDNWLPAILEPVGPVWGRVGESFSLQLEASDEGSNFRAVGLPPGLVIDSETGTVTGTPVEEGVFEVSFLTGEPGNAQRPVVLEIPVYPVEGSPPQIHSLDEIRMKFPSTFTSRSITIDNLDRTSIVTVDGLPDGLYWDDYDMKIRGQPTATGVFTLSVTASNLYGESQAEVPLLISADTFWIFSVDSPPRVEALVGVPFSYEVKTSSRSGGIIAVNVDPPFTLTSTESHPGSYDDYMTASTVDITVPGIDDIIIDTPGGDTGAIDVNIDCLELIGGIIDPGYDEDPFIAEEITFTNLPPGLSFDPATNLISGIPEAGGTYEAILAARSGELYKYRTIEIDVLDAFEILEQPRNTAAMSGEPVSLSATLYPSVGFGLQWFKNGEPVVDENGVSGAQTATLNIESLGESNTGSYSLQISRLSQDFFTRTARVDLLRAFSDWLAAEIPAPGRDGFLDDANGDGIPNGIAFALNLDDEDPYASLPFVTFIDGRLAYAYRQPYDVTGVQYSVLCRVTPNGQTVTDIPVYLADDPEGGGELWGLWLDESEESGFFQLMVLFE